MVWKCRASTASASFLPCVKPQPPESTGATARSVTATIRDGVEVFIRVLQPNAKVSDGSQPPMTFGLHSEPAGWLRSLDRLVQQSQAHRLKNFRPTATNLP